MRISTFNQFTRSVDTLQLRQGSLQQAQERLISGKRVARASDDPTAAARAERALAQKGRVDASQRALEASKVAMQQAETALGNAADLLQRIRELTVQAGNGAYGDPQRRAIADEIRGLRSELLSVANRGDGAGGYLFGGQGSAAPPFVDGTAGVQFRGTQGQREAAMPERLPMTVDGEAVWLQSPTGNSVFTVTQTAGAGSGAWVDGGSVVDPQVESTNVYPFTVSISGVPPSLVWSVSPGTATGAFVSGQAIEFNGIALRITGTPAVGDTFTIAESTRSLSVFDVIDGLSTDLETVGRSGAQVTQTVQDGLREIDAVMATLSSARSRLGGILNQTDGIESRLAESSVAAQAERSLAEDLDMVQGVSDFQAKQTSYDAALKAYSMVQRLSLFDYLR